LKQIELEIRTLEIDINRDIKNSSRWYALGSSYIKKGKLLGKVKGIESMKKAESCFSECRDRSKGPKELFCSKLMLGMVYEEMDRYQEAIKWYNKSLNKVSSEINPSIVLNSREGLARAYAASGKLEDAIKQHRILLEKAPNLRGSDQKSIIEFQTTSYMGLCKIYQAQENRQLLLECLIKALELDPKLDTTLFSSFLAQFFTEEGKFELALKHTQQYLKNVQDAHQREEELAARYALVYILDELDKPEEVEFNRRHIANLEREMECLRKLRSP
jgi:tetratricopeptide (TPR) repeat protein